MSEGEEKEQPGGDDRTEREKKGRVYPFVELVVTTSIMVPVKLNFDWWHWIAHLEAQNSTSHFEINLRLFGINVGFAFIK